MKPPKLTASQRDDLRVLEPALRTAALRGEYEEAKALALKIQERLRPTGHETRLMQAKAWLFEAAMEAGRLDVAEPGFIGIRGKMSPDTRIYLEATVLLAICYLRQKRLAQAEPLVAEALRSRNIKGEVRRRRFLQQIVARFEEEGLLGALVRIQSDQLDPTEIQDLAGVLVRSKTEDEILYDLGTALPGEAVLFLLKVDAMAKRGLTTKEVLYLPGETQILQKAELGRTAFRSFKRVLWRSLCDPESDIYKAWFANGVGWVLDRKYIGTAVAAALVDRGLCIKALAVSATALIIKFGIEIYCDRYRPEFVMEERG
jgi:hypothetical protein